MPTKYTAPMEPVSTLDELGNRKRGRADWVPQRALRYAWQRIDPVHGRGGLMYGGRPRRPGDPETGDAWTWAGFSAPLQADREEIEDVIKSHPEQRARLRQWLEVVERLGRFRDDDRTCAQCDPGTFYELLSDFGYRSMSLTVEGRDAE